MLSIIPKEVLANLTNIHKLLDIGQKLSKNYKKNKKNSPINASNTPENRNAGKNMSNKVNNLDKE